MQKSKSLIVLILFSILLISCGKDYKEVSSSEFINTVLPEVDVDNVEIKKDELMVHTVEEEIYKVNLGSMNAIEKQELLNEIKAKNPGMSESYKVEDGNLST